MTPTKTMYVLSLAPFGVPLAAALAPAQDSEQQCDALLLNMVRGALEDQRPPDLGADWALDFQRHIKAGDMDSAWTAACEPSPGDDYSPFERFIGGNIINIEIQVPSRESQNAAQDATERLRAALSDAGHHLPGASLLELSVRASRIIREHAAQEQAQATRARERALPSSATDDPWRTGAWLTEYHGHRRGRRRQIASREDLGTSERLTLHGSSVPLTHQHGAAYARQGPTWSPVYYVPEHLPHDQALAAFPTPTFRGTPRTWGVPGVEGATHGSSPSACIVARSRAEVVFLCAAQGLTVSMSFLTGYGLTEPGGAMADAALANPGVLMVEDRELTGTTGTFTPYREWAPQVAAHREQRAAQRRAVTP